MTAAALGLGTLLGTLPGTLLGTLYINHTRYSAAATPRCHINPAGRDICLNPQPTAWPSTWRTPGLT